MIPFSDAILGILGRNDKFIIIALKKDGFRMFSALKGRNILAQGVALWKKMLELISPVRAQYLFIKKK